MWIAYAVLVFSVAFFAGMSILIIIRSRQEAKKLRGKNLQVNPKTKRKPHQD
jgi:hypothetical protein